MRRPFLLFIIILVVILIIGGISRRHRLLDPSPVLPSEKQEGATTHSSDVVTTLFSLEAGEYERTVLSDKRQRSYLLHVPLSYNPKSSTELVLFFHGGGGDMYQAADAYGWREKSDQEGFIVAFMNGTSRFPKQHLATWNAGSCCAYARDNDVDDIAYIKRSIEDIRKDFNIQTDAVFATGFSNGGMLMHRLACDAPELVNAVVAVSGTDGTASCNPKTQIPIMHIHAIDDTHVIFTGGAGEESFRDLSQVAEFVSVPETANRWVGRYGLNSTPTRIFENKRAYCDRYTGSSAGGSFTLCVTPDGKHSWPDAPKPAHSGAIPTKTIRGTDIAWDFFMKKF